MTTAIGRADIVRLLDSLGTDDTYVAARYLGYEKPSATTPEREDSKATGAATAPARVELPIQPGIERNEDPVPFLRLEAMEFFEPTKLEKPKGGGLTQDDLEGPGRSWLAPGKPPPLAPWSKLWPVIRGLIQRRCEARSPDVPALVRLIGRGIVPHRIPRLVRATWPASVAVWRDLSPRLAPIWADQQDVLKRLKKVCGPAAVKERRLDSPTHTACLQRRGHLAEGKRLDGQTSVLVLGDLGCYGSATEQQTWLATARCLEKQGAPLAALVPCPKARWAPQVAKAWNAAPWEQGRSSRGATSDEGTPEQRAEGLLTLLSATFLAQPGLVRAVRRLLPSSEADIGTEMDLWGQNAHVAAADGTGLILQQASAERLRQELKKKATAENKALLEGLRDAIASWHGGLFAELLHAETLLWKTLIPSDVAAAPGEVAGAEGFFTRVGISARRAEAEVAGMVRGYGQAVLAGVPKEVYENRALREHLYALWAAAFKGVDGVIPPPGTTPAELFSLLGDPGEAGWWSIRQVGKNLVFQPSTSRWPSEDKGAGSPVAWLFAASREVFVGPSEHRRQTLHLHADLKIPWNGTDDLWIVSDRSKLHLAVCYREPWMQALGRDRYGMYADADIQGVVQRFRWIPPGRSWIGSPENEEGRYPPFEGKRFHVTWTRGRWLGDTPVTQALWQAVMGQNPSRFKTPDRPVESVSWEECQAFCERLVELGVYLPGESEWEYACRGGTETATWVGDLKILGEGNAPVLDPIAWYGGNSGEGFELDNGYDSTDWPNKQYQHSKAGSRPVAMKEANPLGLFDMLGNVWEWCSDHTEGDMKRADDDLVDPSHSTSGIDRVIRGGSWDGDARYVRAACRGLDAPAYRGDDLGFRLARGRAPSPGGGAPGAERKSGSGLGGGAPAAERLLDLAAERLSGSPAAERLSGSPAAERRSGSSAAKRLPDFFAGKGRPHVAPDPDPKASGHARNPKKKRKK